MRIDDLDHLPETTTIDASSIGIVQVSAEHAGQGVSPEEPSRCQEQPLGQPLRVTLISLSSVNWSSPQEPSSFCEHF